MSWINDPVNSPKHYTDSHPGMECIGIPADTALANLDILLDHERNQQ